MKTILNSFWILATLVAVGCNTTTEVDLTKSASLTVRATGQSKSVNSGGRIASTTSGDLEITSAKVTIADIHIEENSGNDNEDEGDLDNDEQNENEKESDNEGPESDIVLDGPYVLELTNNLSIISDVQVFPGTYKKVNFRFASGPDDAIIIKGKYTYSGVTTPFTLSSAFDQPIQLLLANGGIIVAANTTKDIDIVFDTDSWLETLDFSAATITNGEVIIDKNNNPQILAGFEAVLKQYIDAEED